MEEKVFLMPRIGDMAPDFEAVTTTGKLKFSEYNKGSWVVFFSHPADFTPVCTTELGKTALLNGEFTKRGVKAIAISVDSLESHNKWVPDIEEVNSVQMNFPIIADPEINLAATLVKLARLQ